MKDKIVGVSAAIWIPLIWMILAGSRYVSQWLNLDASMSSAEAYFEGSPLDASVFLALIIAGMVILFRRRVNWSKVLTQNAWIWIFFIFCVTSILWSDYPFVSFKRWIKAFGNVIMALVILTEVHPYEAIGVVLRRFSFLLLPLSVLFIKYYPDLGRTYHMGMPMFTGVAFQKNGLGQICLISGIYFFWDLLLGRKKRNESGRRFRIHIYLITLAMIVWLLDKANSATSLACMLVALCLFIAGRQPAMARRPRRIVSLVVACIALFGALQLSFDLKGAAIDMLGRTPDLTDRIPIWEDLLGRVENPIIGVGYEMFWSGERMTLIWEKFGEIWQAHNGYIDIYLNIGIVGLGFLVISIISGGLKAIKHLDHDYAYALLRISFIMVAIFYNWTEAAFKPVSNIFVLLLLGLMEGTTSGSEREGER